MRIVHRNGGGQQAAAQQFLRAVEVEQQLVEEVGALAQAGGQGFPFVGRDEHRQHVERPELRARLLAAVDVHADVLLDDGTVAGLGGGLEGGSLVAA